MHILLGISARKKYYIHFDFEYGDVYLQNDGNEEVLISSPKKGSAIIFC
jgi:hypothetical protein